MNNAIIKLKDIIGLGTDEIERLREDAECDIDVLKQHVTFFTAGREDYDMAAERLAGERARGLLANAIAGSQANLAAIKEVVIDLKDLDKVPEVVVNTPEKFAEAREIFGESANTGIYICDKTGRYDMVLDAEQRVDDSYVDRITELWVRIAKRLARFVKEGE